MDDTFKIFVHRLKDGHREQISEIVSPEFLDIHEADLAFNAPINLQGTAEMVEEVFVLRLNIETEATLPCAICNKDVQIKISINDFCFTEPLEKIKAGVFNYLEVLREAVLLELPHATECGSGDCPERETLAKYFNHQENEEN